MGLGVGGVVESANVEFLGQGAMRPSLAARRHEALQWTAMYRVLFLHSPILAHSQQYELESAKSWVNRSLLEAGAVCAADSSRSDL